MSKATATADNKTKIAICDAFSDWLDGPMGLSSCGPNAGATACPVGQEMAGFSYVLSLRAMAQVFLVICRLI
eukprot:COSAG02_NODE_39703_length_414_cov_0.495238_1_plen_72_part_00